MTSCGHLRAAIQGANVKRVQQTDCGGRGAFKWLPKHAIEPLAAGSGSWRAHVALALLETEGCRFESCRPCPLPRRATLSPIVAICWAERVSHAERAVCTVGPRVVLTREAFCCAGTQSSRPIPYGGSPHLRVFLKRARVRCVALEARDTGVQRLMDLQDLVEAGDLCDAVDAAGLGRGDELAAPAACVGVFGGDDECSDDGGVDEGALGEVDKHLALGMARANASVRAGLTLRSCSRRSLTTAIPSGWNSTSSALSVARLGSSCSM